MSRGYIAVLGQFCANQSMFTLVIHLDQQTTKNRFNAGQNIVLNNKTSSSSFLDFTLLSVVSFVLLLVTFSVGFLVMINHFDVVRC